jgi:hypothetical protein
VLLDVLKTLKGPEELDVVAQAASEFLVEVLATFEMIQRTFSELRESPARRPDPGPRADA